MIIDHDNLEDFQDPHTYDLTVGDYNDDRPLIEQWARTLGSPLLDLACGTGRMAVHLAGLGYTVTGVDLVPGMIELGKQKAAEQSVSVEWVVSDARSFHLGRQFACIFMLENVFQFFLTRADQEAMLACVREHLTETGCFIFETRNPSLRNLMEVRHPEPQNLTAPDGSQLVITEEQHYDPITQIQHYKTYHNWLHPDGQRQQNTLRTALRYVFPQEMEALLYYNGFQIHTVYGSWQQEPLTAASPAMIYVCQKRA